MKEVHPLMQARIVAEMPSPRAHDVMLAAMKRHQLGQMIKAQQPKRKKKKRRRRR